MRVTVSTIGLGLQTIQPYLRNYIVTYYRKVTGCTKSKYGLSILVCAFVWLLTTNLFATSGVCLIDADCDDANVCTDDSCNAGTCVNSFNYSTCDDADACTENDICTQGMCLGTVINSVACAPLFSIKIVAIDGVDLAGGPTDQWVASRGDVITFELFASRWAPRAILASNLLIDRQSFFSGDTGTILPVTVPDPNAGAFIDEARPDFIFIGLPMVALVFNESIDFLEYLAVITDVDICRDDPGSEVYLGTLITEVSDTASGTFNICPQAFFDDITITFMTLCPDGTVIEPSDLACATVEIPLGNCNRLPDCNTNGQWDVCDVAGGNSLDCNRNDVPDDCDIRDSSSDDCNQNQIPDECDIANGLSTDCDANGIPDECDPDCNGNGVADACDIAGSLSFDCDGNGIPDECALFFVDASANGNNDGSSWVDAFPTLQSAITAMKPMCGPGREIWVAQGTYRPDVVDGDRSASFELLRGVAIYGGFVANETNLDERSTGLLTTILSGDLNANDTSDPTSKQDNSYHVIRAVSVNASAILDGFVIRDGYADGIDADANGAGIHLTAADPVVANSLVVNNYAINDGAGAWTIQGRPSFVNCIFNGNQADNFGGGLRHVTGIPIVTNSTFTANIAGAGGGGVFSGRSDAGNNAQTIPSSVHMTNVILWGNAQLQLFNQRESAQIVATVPNIDFSCVEGLTPQLGGIGNIGDDPLFVDADGPDNIAGNTDDNLRLALGSPSIDKGDNLAPAILLSDFDGRLRIDQCRTDMGAFESPHFADCNASGIGDACEIEDGLVTDCNDNLTPDECEIDCNGNGIADSCEIENGTSLDCNNNAIPDECELDCNQNTIPDDCDISDANSTDCNHNGIPDECDLASQTSSDCNANVISDDCEVREAFLAGSQRFIPITAGVPMTFPFDPAPLAIDNVSIAFLGRGDLGAADEFLSVTVGGVFVGLVYVDNARECAPFGFDVDEIVVSAAVFNQAIELGGAIIEAIPSDAVDSNPCTSPADLLIFVSYDGPSALDCDANLIPDECEIDTDADGLIDPCDECPNDPDKSLEGVCGCGVSDVDSDGDTVPDCIDRCPNFDDTLDQNADGLADCLGIPTLSSWGLIILLLSLLTVTKAASLQSKKYLHQ